MVPYDKVETGEVRVIVAPGHLESTPLGSCIAVAAFDLSMPVVGVAHVMLPGCAPPAARHTLRYADNAIREMLMQMNALGSTTEQRVVCLAGGGNVLRRDDDIICAQLIESVMATCGCLELHVVAQSVGGNLRRGVWVDAESRSCYCAIGDGSPFLLWSASDSPVGYAGMRSARVCGCPALGEVGK